MKLDFVIAGVQKAGTTALWGLLRKHPQISLSNTKELHFFDNEGIDWSRPPYLWIATQLSDTPATRVRGEATPIYTYWPTSMARIQAYNPKIKLITVLRDPVERAYSHWRMERARNLEALSFSQSIREGRLRVDSSEFKGVHRVHSYVERGFYMPQIERMLAMFARDQLLFLSHSQFFFDPNAAMDAVTDFLGVDRFQSYPDSKLEFSFAETYPHPMSDTDRRYLEALYRDDVANTEKLTGISIR